MKKFVTASLFVFFAVTSGVAVVGLVSDNKNSPAITGLNSDGIGLVDQTNVSIAKVNSETAGLVLSKVELAKHNSGASCWLLISGKIYDVTTFLNQHPGNASTILPTCGTDATAAYATRGGTGSHSSSATSMLAGYYIGDLNQTVTTSPNPSTGSQPPQSSGGQAGQANPTLLQSRGDDDEFDD